MAAWVWFNAGIDRFAVAFTPQQRGQEQLSPGSKKSVFVKMSVDTALRAAHAVPLAKNLAMPPLAPPSRITNTSPVRDDRPSEERHRGPLAWWCRHFHIPCMADSAER